MSEVIISTILFFTVLLLTSRRFQCGSCQTLLIEYAIWEPKHITNTYCIFPLFPSFPTSIFSQDRFFNTFPFKIYLQTWKRVVKKKLVSAQPLYLIQYLPFQFHFINRLFQACGPAEKSIISPHPCFSSMELFSGTIFIQY